MGKTKKVSQKATNTNSSAFVGGPNNGTIIINPPSIAEELGVIANIFGYIIENIELCNDYDRSKPPEGWIKTVDKIKLNFELIEFDAIKFYYKNAIPKLRMIGDYYRTLDSENQADLHSHLFEMYSRNKVKGMSAIENIHLLFEGVTPVNQRSNTQYTSMAKALVLFFFEDCTIFEKTVSESVQLEIW